MSPPGPHDGFFCNLFRDGLSVRADQRVDLRALDIVAGIYGGLDLPLVSSQINNKHKGVVIFNLFHCALSRQRKLDDPKLVKFVRSGNGPALVLGVPLSTPADGRGKKGNGVSTGAIKQTKSGMIREGSSHRPIVLRADNRSVRGL